MFDLHLQGWQGPVPAMNASIDRFVAKALVEGIPSRW
jgi:hypothetical protein